MGNIKDRGIRGLTHKDKPLVLQGASWIDPSGVAMLFEDFIGLGATLADNPKVLITQSGTPSTAAAVTATAGAPFAGHGGWVAGSVDNVDAEIDELALGKKPWMGVSRARTVLVGEVGFVIPAALTAQQHFFGLTDDETEGTATNGSLNIQTGTTLVAVADDAAGFIYSSLATDADGYYVSSVNATTGGTVTNSGLTGVVDKYTKLRVEIDAAGNAYFYGVVDAGSAGRTVTPAYILTQAGAVATTALLLPLFTTAATTTTAAPWEVDYIFGAVAG